MNNFDPFADFRMQGQVAVVTGGAQNIGAAIARSFAGAGAQVAIADLNGEKAEETAHEIATRTGGDVIGMACNVTRRDDIDACVKKTVEVAGSDPAMAWPDPPCDRERFRVFGRFPDTDQRAELRRVRS